MTDKVNQKIVPETDASEIADNPVDELARIMGYNSDPAPNIDQAMTEGDPAAGLEAELMREFGIDMPDEQSDPQATAPSEDGEPVLSDTPNILSPAIDPADQSASIENNVAAEPNLPKPDLGSIPADTIVEQQPADNAGYNLANFSGNTEPSPAAGDDVLAEMSQYSVPNQDASAPNESDAPAISATVAAPTQIPQVGDHFANDLEQELANLQKGLSDGLTADVANLEATPVAQEADVSEPIVPVPSLDDAAQSMPELEDVVDMSAVNEIESDVESTTDFDIPSIEPVAPVPTPEPAFDADLDTELEREFSQMFADDNVAEATAVSAEEESKSQSIPLSEQDVGSFFDLGAMNDDRNVPAAEAAAIASVTAQPERIDVTNDQGTPPEVADGANAGGSSKGKIVAFGIFALLLMGTGFYIVSNNVSFDSGESGEPVVVKADNSPIKEVPADPGGTSVPNQDQAVYDQVEGTDTSVASQPSLVESTEEPVDIVQNTLDPSLLPLEGRGEAEKAEDRLVSGDQQIAPVGETAAQPLIVPKKVRTVVVQSDGTIITREEPAAVEQPVAQAESTSSQTAANDSTTPAASTEQLTPTPALQEIAAVDTSTTQPATPEPAPTPTPAPAATEQAVVQPAQPATQPEPEPTPAPATQTAAAQPVANYSGYYMQIASQPSLDAAQSSYQNLSNRYSSILGNRGVEYQRAEIEGKGIYHRVRIQAGTRAEANSLCSQYKSAGGSCFVAR